MSDLLKEHITKPKADDMSMDEILASIRRIISTSSTSEEAKKTPEPEYKYNNHVETKQAPKREQALSAREQLLALTKPNLYDSDFTPDNRFLKPTQRPTSGQPQQAQQTPHIVGTKTVENVYQKPFYDSLSKESKNQTSVHDTPKESLHKENDDNHDAEILQALNEIRETLGHTIQSSLPPKETIQNHKDINTEAFDNRVSSQINTPIIPIKETNVIQSKEAIFDEINLRSPQITGDAVPEFLKNFKRQQELDKQKNQKKSNAPEYDFSKLSNFNEGEKEVLTLTEKIMPMSQQELKQQEDLEKTTKRNLSRLREGTEEIMKRATERHFDNFDDDDVTEEDTNMTNVIMRTLKPMLQEWIDENMHKIAEQVLRQEFRRGLK